LDLIVRTFCTAEHHIVFAEPSFVVYRMAALAHGVPFTAVPLRDYVHDLPAMTAAVRPNTRVVFVANPNNPTGTGVTADALTAFVRSVPAEVIVVIDEAYIEYADPLPVDALTLRESHPNVVCLRTFSKIYGLAALRLGYAVANAEIVHYLDCVRAPFNVSSIAQAAGLAALGDTEHVKASCELNRSERARIAAALVGRGIKVVPSQANFVLIELGRPAQPIYQALLQRGVIVRPIAVLPNCLRVTIGLPAENDRLLSSLAEVLA
jgi:histidinol-phosphate aminotransferase